MVTLVLIKKTNRRGKLLLHTTKGLSKRVAEGGIWSFALRITVRSLALIRIIVLARLLAPNDFGLMGIALLLMMAIEKFSEMGLSTALVQKKGDVDEYLDTAWTAQVIRSILLFSILFTTAPLIATFFNASKAVAIIRVIAFVQLFKGLTNIGVVYFRKELEFNKQFVYQFSIIIVNFGVTISAALILKNVWALVFGLLAGEFVGFAISYVIHPYKPRVKMDWRKFTELFNYGKWVLGCVIIIFWATQGDSIFLGKILGVLALGFYQMACRISAFLNTEIAATISIVVFPALSKLQENIQKLQKGFLKSLEVTAAICVPISVGIVLLGFDFTRIFLGEKWMPMVPALQILAISGPILAIMRIIDPLFGAVGRPKLTFFMYLSRFGTMAIFILPLTKNFGLVGTSIAVLLGVLLTIPIWWHKAAKIVGVSSYRLFREIAPSIVGTFIMSIFITITRQPVQEFGVLGFFLLVLIGVLSYLGFLLLLWRNFHYGPIGSLLFIKQSLEK